MEQSTNKPKADNEKEHKKPWQEVYATVEDIKDKSDTNLDTSDISCLDVNSEKQVDINADTDNTKVYGIPEIIAREDVQTENKAEEVKKKDTNDFDIDFAKKKIRAYYKRMGITYIVNSDDQMLVKRD